MNNQDKYKEPEYDMQEMDHRHVAMIGTFLKSRPFKSVMEIGCWKGRCTSVILNAHHFKKVNSVTLCDVAIKPEIREMTKGIRHCNTLEMTGKEALQGAEPYIYDVVILDNGHSLDVSREEWIELARHKPEVLILHDVTAPAAGYENCEGPGWMLEEIRRAGYSVVIDNEKRENERTHRGLAFCCRTLELLELAKEAINSHL